MSPFVPWMDCQTFRSLCKYCSSCRVLGIISASASIWRDFLSCGKKCWRSLVESQHTPGNPTISWLWAWNPGELGTGPPATGVGTVWRLQSDPSHIRRTGGVTVEVMFFFLFFFNFSCSYTIYPTSTKTIFSGKRCYNHVQRVELYCRSSIPTAIRLFQASMSLCITSEHLKCSFFTRFKLIFYKTKCLPLHECSPVSF